MRIEQLMLTGFGRFRRFGLSLAPGLNVVYGPNEAGKSTVQRFILGMLYGLKKRSQRRDYTEDAYRYQPWDGGEYRGALLFRLDATGRPYRVERQFTPGQDAVRIYDEETGADLTSSFPMDRRKELLFAEALWKLPEEVFRSTAWIGQLAVGKLEMGRELVARVANMQESGREDLSVRAALARLDDWVKEIGSERAPTRPYGRVVRELAGVRQALDRAARARGQTRAWESRLAEARGALAAIDQELGELNRLAGWAALREATDRLRRVEEAGRRAREAGAEAEALAAWAAFPAAQREQLLHALAEAEAAVSRAEGHRARAGSLRAERAAAQEKLDAAGEDDEFSFQARLGALEAEAAGLTAALAEAEVAVAPPRERQGFDASPLWGAVSVVLAAGAVGAWVYGWLLVAMVLALAALGCLAGFVRARAAARAREEQRIREAEERAALAARRAGEEARLERVRAEIDQVKQAAVRHRQRLWQEQTLRVGALDRELTEARQQERREADKAEALEEAAREILAGAGVDTPEAFLEGCARRDRWQKAAAEAETLEGALRSLLGSERAETLSAEVERLRGLATGEEPGHDGRSLAELSGEIRRLEARRSDLKAEASDLSARVESALQEAPDTADLHRELKALEEQQRAFDEELAALELARGAIEAVSGEIHREFAPRLNEAMGRVVAGLTGGKYRELRVDESLAIRVVTGDDRTVGLDSLSGGTVDQIYLGLRLALLDLLTGGEEPVPLILDDPFVQYDDDRARMGMAWLERLSEERQVILLTCHRREASLAQSAHLINLTDAATGGTQ